MLALTPDGYAEGFYSVPDKESQIDFREYPRAKELLSAAQGNWEAARIAWFSHGFFKLNEDGGRLVISDLRMGGELVPPPWL